MFEGSAYKSTGDIENIAPNVAGAPTYTEMSPR
jgi:hypothetical protein